MMSPVPLQSAIPLRRQDAALRSGIGDNLSYAGCGNNDTLLRC